MSKCRPTNRVSGFLPAHFGEVDSLLNQFFAPTGYARSTAGVSRVPASVWEADEKIHLEIDAPGVVAEDVDVTFENGQLSVELERRSPFAEGDGEAVFAYNQRAFGKSGYALALPETVDPDSIEADLTNGVLHVTVAKLPEAQPKRIDVRKS